MCCWPEVDLYSYNELTSITDTMKYIHPVCEKIKVKANAGSMFVCLFIAFSTPSQLFLIQGCTKRVSGAQINQLTTCGASGNWSTPAVKECRSLHPWALTWKGQTPLRLSSLFHGEVNETKSEDHNFKNKIK